MDLGIKGKVALITGGARGLGRATAKILAEEGAKIAVVDVNMKDDAGWGAEITAEKVREAGGEAKAYKVDITDFKQVEEAIKSIKSDLGQVDILINAAATIDHTAKILQQAPALWERDLKVNLTGQYNMVRAVFGGMMEKQWGRIINFASVAGTLGGFGQLSYSTTKAGMIGFTKTIALEGAKFGITSNCIVPGLIETEIVKFMPEQNRERIKNRTAFKKLGETEDIAYAIAFLVSERAKYITGETLYIDGGIQLFTF